MTQPASQRRASASTSSVSATTRARSPANQAVSARVAATDSMRCRSGPARASASSSGAHGSGSPRRARAAGHYVREDHRIGEARCARIVRTMARAGASASRRFQITSAAVSAARDRLARGWSARASGARQQTRDGVDRQPTTGDCRCPPRCVSLPLGKGVVTPSVVAVRGVGRGSGRDVVQAAQRGSILASDARFGRTRAAARTCRWPRCLRRELAKRGGKVTQQEARVPWPVHRGMRRMGRAGPVTKTCGTPGRPQSRAARARVRWGGISRCCGKGPSVSRPCGRSSCAIGVVDVGSRWYLQVSFRL